MFLQCMFTTDLRLHHERPIMTLGGNDRKSVVVYNCCWGLSHSLASLCWPGSVKYDKRMYFLENDRRYCRTYNNLEASLQKELSFYQQKAKEWAEVHTHSFLFFCKIIHGVTFVYSMYSWIFFNSFLCDLQNWFLQNCSPVNTCNPYLIHRVRSSASDG